MNDTSDTRSFPRPYINTHTNLSFQQVSKKFIIGHLFKSIVLQEHDFIEENNNMPSKAVEVKNSLPLPKP